MDYSSHQLAYAFMVGFFLLAGLDMLRRVFDIRLSYEQVRPRSPIVRFVVVITMSMFLGWACQWAGQEFGTAGPANSKTALVVDKTGNGAIGGMVWLDPSNLLLVRDSKNFDKVTFKESQETDYALLPIAMATMGVDGITINNLRLSTSNSEVEKENAPSDLEAVCIPTQTDKDGDRTKVKTDRSTIIATESGRYKEEEGQIFLIEVSRSLTLQGNKRKVEWKTDVIGFENLPKQVGANGNELATAEHQVEGIACFKQPKSDPAAPDQYTILLGYRGKHDLPVDQSKQNGAIALLTDVDFVGTTPLPTYKAADPKPVKGPVPSCATSLPEGTSGDWRDVSDLHVTDDGEIWSVATIDVGNEGPFCSTAYRIPLKVNYNGTAWQLIEEPGATGQYQVPGHKVEALIGKEPASKKLMYAYDDEDLGSGIITP